MNMKKKSGIYMWTSPSGKKYIGQSIDLVKRYNQFLDFNHRYGGKKINDARTKYHTIDEWSYKVLEYCGIDDLDERETYYIGLYDAMNNGYNCESGGNKNKILSDEAKLNIKISKTGDKNPNFGTHRTDKTKQKISEALKGRTLTEEEKRKRSEAMKGKYCGENNPMYGKHLTEEHKSKLSEAMKGRYCGEKNPMWGKHFTDEHKRKLSEAKKGENNPMYGKHRDNETKDKMRLSHSKPVVQYTKEGEFVAEYESALVAKNITGIDNGCIGACCLGKLKSAGGFKWTFKNPPLLKE